MGILKGQFEHEKYCKGMKLTRREAIFAQCYVCNGEEDGGVDCLGAQTCPLYRYFPYKGKKEAVSDRVVPTLPPVKDEIIDPRA